MVCFPFNGDAHGPPQHHNTTSGISSYMTWILPLSLNTVTLTWDITDLVQAGQQARIILTPSAVLTDATDHLVIPQVSRSVPFVGGTGSLPGVIATDNSQIQPAGWSYTIQVIDVNGRTIVAPFNCFIPYSAGATQDLSTLTPIFSIVTMQGYDPLGSAAAAQAAAEAYAAAQDIPLASSGQFPNSIGQFNSVGVGTSSAHFDHIHAPGSVDVSASALGLSMWTLPPSRCSGLLGPNAQTMVCVLAYAEASATVNHLGVWVDTAGVTPGGTGINALAVYSEAGALLGHTGDMTAAFEATTYAEGSLNQAVSLTAGSNYYLALVHNFTGTSPQFFAGQGVAQYPVIRGHYLSVAGFGITSFPATITPSSMVAGGTPLFLTAGS